MGFKIGDPRPAGAGRRPGAPNKKSLLVRELLEKNNINLIECIIEKLPVLDEEEQIKAMIQLLPYVYPKLTSVEHSGEIANPYLDKPLEELKAMVKDNLDK